MIALSQDSCVCFLFFYYLQHFVKPLRQLGIVPENDIRIMFGDITAIQAINKELLAHMEEMSIGEAFLQLAPYIKLYSTYANNFEKAVDLLQVCIIQA